MSALTEADHEEITDTLLAARERIEHLTICGAALQAENDRLKAAVEELAKDAGRYRFLRDSGWNECSHPEVWRQVVNEYDGLDEAIDAAMKGQ